MGRTPLFKGNDEEYYCPVATKILTKMKPTFIAQFNLIGTPSDLSGAIRIAEACGWEAGNQYVSDTYIPDSKRVVTVSFKGGYYKWFDTISEAEEFYPSWEFIPSEFIRYCNIIDTAVELKKKFGGMISISGDDKRLEDFISIAKSIGYRESFHILEEEKEKYYSSEGSFLFNDGIISAQDSVVRIDGTEGRTDLCSKIYPLEPIVLLCLCEYSLPELIPVMKESDGGYVNFGIGRMKTEGLIEKLDNALAEAKAERTRSESIQKLKELVEFDKSKVIVSTEGTVNSQRDIILENAAMAQRFNKGKLQWSLVHFKSLESFVKVLEMGAKEYAPDNWKKPMDKKQILESAQRHLAALMDGETHDAESMQYHVGHIMCNCMFWAYQEENNK